MISFADVSKQYGRQVLFVDASFQLNPGEKAGLVGPNGAGKSTLFRMIAGEESADDGEVNVPKKSPSATSGRKSTRCAAVRCSTRRSPAAAASATCTTSSIELEQEDLHDEKALDRYGEVQEEYQHNGGYELEARAREVLHGLGFDDDQIDGDVGALSGGWKMRVSMARILLGKFDVLLLDEPTNHLDIESIVWLERFLSNVPATILMTSHDRDFMNRIVTKIVEIDDGDIVTYPATTTSTSASASMRETNQEAAYARQQAKLAKEQRFIDRFTAHAAKAAQVQSRIKMLDKQERSSRRRSGGR